MADLSPAVDPESGSTGIPTASDAGLPGPSDDNGLSLTRLMELAQLEADAEAEREDNALAPETSRYVASDWTQYVEWCDLYGLPADPIDPHRVATYVYYLGTLINEDSGLPRYAVGSIRRKVTSLGRKRYEQGGGRGLGDHEVVSAQIKALARRRQEGKGGKTPLLLMDVKRMITEGMSHNSWPAGAAATRDTFAILLGFAAARRRSEVASLTCGQITLHPLDGLHIRLRKTKTDQEGHGAVLAVPYGENPITCVPCAYVRWMRVMNAPDLGAAQRLVFGTPGSPANWTHVCKGDFPEGDPASPLFRRVSKTGRVLPPTQRRKVDKTTGEVTLGEVYGLTGSALNEVIKRRLTEAGYGRHLDSYGYHSLRAGFVVEARRAGASHREVRRQTLHASDAMVDWYDRDASPLHGNGVLRIGL